VASKWSYVVACPVAHVTADQANRLAQMMSGLLKRSATIPANGLASA
jgi:hypothetical protein